MRPDVIAPPTFRHPDLIPSIPSTRTGPITVAVGVSVDSTLRAGTIVAQRLDRGIAVISVIEPTAVYLWSSPSIPDQPDHIDHNSVERWSFLEQQMRVAAVDGPNWSVEVFWGGVPRTVARAAHDLHAPYIVMGGGRHRPVDRLLGGETALRTIRHADCPVLVVMPGFDAMPRAIVAGTDFSDASAHAVRAAFPLLGAGATLHLVHAWQPTSSSELMSAHDEQYRRELPARLARFAAALDAPRGLSLRTEVVEGRPADMLLEVAREHDADLIVVGRHGRSVIERLVVGSVATRVLRGATRAVLVVPEPAPALRVRLAEARGGSTREVPREDWGSVLDQFTRHFVGRVAALDVNDPDAELSTQERGSVLFGVEFDPQRDCVEIILGEANGRRRRLTRVIPNPSALCELLGPSGDEEGLHIAHGTGETLLTILSPGSYSKS